MFVSCSEMRSASRIVRPTASSVERSESSSWLELVTELSMIATVSTATRVKPAASQSLIPI